MSIELPTAGAASEDLQRRAHQWWIEESVRVGTDLTDFDEHAPLPKRISWALRIGLLIACIYTRFSMKGQHSTADQIRECILWAARNGMYIPPELICVDEAVKGRRIRRDGLERLKQILREKLATVLLVFKASRLFRQAYKGYQLIQEEVVEEGLRAVSISQGIDTDDKKSWKTQLQVHGLLDDLLLDAIADHVRAGLKGLHLNGWTTGAVGVGYRAVEDPSLPKTNRGLIRRVPQVDPEVAELIQKHAQCHLDGMSLKEGWRRWIDAGGPADPRSPSGEMSYNAYRRLWSNVRLTGQWPFGRKRNQFSTKLDYVRQIDQPDEEVVTHQCEELRILDDETFLRLQQLLDGYKQGPRGPRKLKQAQLWDLVTECFYCARCSTPENPVRYYQTGANGKGMQCKKGDRCPCKSTVKRRDAVLAVCEQLVAMIARDGGLIEDVVCRSTELDSEGDENVQSEIALQQREITGLTRQLDGLYRLAGEGTEEDQREVQDRIRSARSERAAAQLELARLEKVLAGSTATLTTDDVRQLLSDTSAMLQDAAAGALGDDCVHKAQAVFRRLTGGQIMVHVEQRAGRKRTNVRGVFRPRLLLSAKPDASSTELSDLPSEEVTVWLRKPPRVDRLAERVHQLIDIEGLSLRAAAKLLQAEGHNVNSGNLWYSYERYYEMHGLEKPKMPYNNGHQRRPRSA